MSMSAAFDKLQRKNSIWAIRYRENSGIIAYRYKGCKLSQLNLPLRNICWKYEKKTKKTKQKKQTKKNNNNQNKKKKNKKKKNNNRKTIDVINN